MTVDADSNVYVTGDTNSYDFPTSGGAYDTSLNGARDQFVSKLNASGAMVFSTFLGGYLTDRGIDVAVDSQRNVYVTGAASSHGFPVTWSEIPEGRARHHVNVTKLSPTGSALIYSALFGGYDWDWGDSIAIDAAGNAYVSGGTWSSNFPVTEGAADSHGATKEGFVARLNAKGNGLDFSTYLGGSGEDDVRGMYLDESGDVYVTGYSGSTDFPVTAGALDTTHNGTFDAFVTRVNSTGTAFSYSSFLGGSGREQGEGITVDAAGNIYLTGWTASPDFPTMYPLQATLAGAQDAFVTVLDATGSTLEASTYLGGSGTEMTEKESVGIALDSIGNVYVAGTTESSDFPVTSEAYDTSYNGSGDAFVARLPAYLSWRPADPAARTQGLIETVLDLGLHHGTENSLVKKLDGALKKLNDCNPNNDHVALGKLNAFINEVEAQRGKKISEDGADELIAEASLIVQLLEHDLL